MQNIPTRFRVACRELGIACQAREWSGEEKDLGECLPARFEHGFAAVLTDFIAGALDGAAPDPEFYEAEEGGSSAIE